MSVLNTRGPVIGITMGDAAGIGPEIVLKSLNAFRIRKAIRPVIIGDLAYLKKLSVNLSVNINLVELDPDKELDRESVEVFDVANIPDQFAIGIDAYVTGKAAAEYIVEAVSLWKEGRIDAVATAPISKMAIGIAGYNYPGHTEFLAELTGTTKFAMSFFADNLRVVLLSTHLPLTAAIQEITEEKLVELIRFAHVEIGRLLNKTASIAVAGLNPHASEGGMFGTEEALFIEPAILRCKDEGINVTGPYSPDTIFLRGYRGEFDACIALYHDQATIAVKSLSFGSGVNVTLGLPLIRTSVDHGTAYDIAGTGTADYASMLAAIELAGDLVLSKQASHSFC